MFPGGAALKCHQTNITLHTTKMVNTSPTVFSRMFAVLISVTTLIVIVLDCNDE